MIPMKNAAKERIYNIYKWVKHPEKAVCRFCEYDHYRYAHLIPDKLFLKCIFKKYMKTRLDLTHPVTFNEKLQWLKLYNRRPEYTRMADKAEVKQLVAEKIGSKYIIPTFGVYTSVEDIPFEELPDRFVIKCTHDSGSVIVCKSKRDFDVETVKQKLSDRLKVNYFWYSREWPYKNITPKIIVEEFLDDPEREFPLDYKFFCFNGKAEFFKVDFNRFNCHRANYYDRDMNIQPFGRVSESPPDQNLVLDKPENFDKMLEIVEKLSDKIPFVRVDLYYVNHQIYVGELTFFPAGGIGGFTGNGDEIMGKYLVLPKKKTK